MTKTELIAVVAEKTGTTKSKAGEIITATFDEIAACLASEKRFQLVDFGTFEVRERAARTGRNPATGEVIEIPASKGVGFKAGKNLKFVVNA